MLTIAIKPDGVQLGERCGISFHRTLRVPDDGQTYPLPPGLGRLPLYKVDLPDLGQALAIPMYRREALWIGFSGAPWKPNAVKVLVGGINAISGLPDDENDLTSPQNYLICPEQPWLDGFDVGKGVIRQFVAMPLGTGYGVEASYPTLREKGGLRIVVFEPKPGHFPDKPPPSLGGPARFNMPRTNEPQRPTLAIGAGGTIQQKVYPDPHGIEVWDRKAFGAVDIVLLEAAAFTSLTGITAPPTPIEIGTYEANGLPWFELYDEPAESVEPSDRRKLRTIAERERSEGGAAPMKTTPTHEIEPDDGRPASSDRHRSPHHPKEKKT